MNGPAGVKEGINILSFSQLPYGKRIYILAAILTPTSELDDWSIFHHLLTCITCIQRHTEDLPIIWIAIPQVRENNMIKIYPIRIEFTINLTTSYFCIFCSCRYTNHSYHDESDNN